MALSQKMSNPAPLFLNTKKRNNNYGHPRCGMCEFDSDCLSDEKTAPPFTFSSPFTQV